jgi:excisionase family DNA binding protein
MQTNDNPFPGYLTTSEAGRRCGVTSDHVARLARTNRARSFRLGRAWLVDEAALKAFLPRPAAPP